MCFTGSGLSWSIFAEGNSFAIISATSTPIDKGRMESVHIKVIVVNKETLSDGRVPVIKSVHVESRKFKAQLGF